MHNMKNEKFVFSCHKQFGVIFVDSFMTAQKKKTKTERKELKRTSMAINLVERVCLCIQNNLNKLTILQAFLNEIITVRLKCLFEKNFFLLLELLERLLFYLFLFSLSQIVSIDGKVTIRTIPSYTIQLNTLMARIVVRTATIAVIILAAVCDIQ